MKPDWFVVDDEMVIDLNSVAAIYNRYDGKTSVQLKHVEDPIEMQRDDGVRIMNEIARRCRQETPLR